MKTKTVLLAALAMALTFGQPALAETVAERRIVVTGEGVVQSAPDLAVISLGVSKEAREAGEAMRAVSEDMAQVIDALRSAGIAPEDLQTRQISLHPIWSKAGSYDSGERRKITGFSASNTLSLRVRDLQQLGPVLDQVLQAGANQFQGLRFDVADKAGLKDAMRQAAVQDAMHKAALLAEAAGMELGPVYKITDHFQGGGGRPMMAMEMARSDALPIEAGDLSFSHSVEVIFDLELPKEE